MIVTVTMNPAIDKTVEIDRLERGGLNRIRAAELDVGGKGINVSKTVKELGGSTVAVGFLGGSAGQVIKNTLQSLGIEHDFVEVEGETRTNTKVFEENGMLTELNESGPVIPEEKLEELLKKLRDYAKEGTLFVLAGSVPKGVKKDIYQKIILMAHENGAKVLMDADGELFRKGVEAVPDMMKPNQIELAGYAGLGAEISHEKIWDVAAGLLEKGTELIAVSMGKEGAVFLGRDYRVKCPGLQVKSHSTVGAGDAMVAALAYAWDRRMDREEMIRTCMAVSAGAVTTVGTKPPSAELVESLKKQVMIEYV